MTPSGDRGGSEPARDPARPPPGVERVGRVSWALVGLALAVAVVGLIASQLTLVLVPLVLALFPATLLSPVAGWLRERGLPDALAAITALFGGLLVLAAVIGVMVPLVIAELPQLAESAGEGIAEIEQLLSEGILGFQADGISELIERAGEQLAAADGLVGSALDAAVVAFEVVAGLLLLLVVLFFYLKDGQRLAAGVIGVLPARLQGRWRRRADSAWDTLGSYFRGQLLVALVDAVVIGIGLVIMGVPLALPLAVLIFFGGLFPIVGAVTTGALAVLVALADAGLVQGLIVLGLVLAVQQLEGNVLEPLVLGSAISLHPLVIVAAITAGAVTLGVLGAFLAVPVAAIAARLIEDVRSGPEPESGTAAA